MLRSRRRGQAIVEFGIIAILFTLIMFAIADFGLLLNDWLSVSSGARQLARDASVGMYSCLPGPGGCPGGITPDLFNQAQSLTIPGVAADPYFTGGYCCTVGTPGSALQVSVVYYNQCTPGPSAPGCTAVPAGQLDSRFSTGGTNGGCNSWQSGTPCQHPASPSTPSTPLVPSCGLPNCPGDSVVVTFKAAGAQVITPLVRPFFTNSSSCQVTSAHCYVPLSSSVTLRVEGDTL